MILKRAWSAGSGLRSALAAVALVAAPAIAQSQQATISGRVTAAGTNEPLTDARVLVVNTTLSAATNADGRFTIRSVPAGNFVVRVLRVGFQEQKKPVTVAAGGAPTVDFVLTQAVVQLQEIVTTATGEQRRVEIGNAVTTLGDINQKVETTPINNIADLMVGKAPGVIVLPAAMTGAAPTIRLRGLRSLATSGSGVSNDPIYVVDGVRYASGNLSLSTGGTTASLLNDLNPAEIEDIEIVKGPSAATLYGTDAANGVIVVTTKRGRAGSTRWNWYGEGGAVSDRNNYAKNYATWGHTAAGAAKRCTLITVSQATCNPTGSAAGYDSITSFDVLRDASTTPMHSGHRDQYGLNISGGSDAVRFFVSGDLQNELGPLHMPGFAQGVLQDSLGVPLRDEWVNPEAFQSQSVRANLSASLSPKFDLTATAGFSKANQRLPQVDNNTFSVYYSAWNNPGFNHNGLGYNELQTVDNASGQTVFRNGYGGFSPSQIFQVYNQNTTQRFTGSTTGTWRPFAWMHNEGTVGLDFAGNDFTNICRFNECPNSGTQRQGTVGFNHTNLRNLSARVISSATWNARSSLSLKTVVGVDYNNQEVDGVNSNGSNLPPGAQTVGAAATRNGGDQLQTVNKTLGLYVQEEAAIRDRMFLTVAVRSDQNSSFGTKLQNVAYPKAQLSWIISDEGFFPKLDWLNQFRVRSAYGESGVAPGGTVALRTFSAQTATIVAGTPGGTNAADLPGLVANALGNPDLKPETATEWESGFDGNVFNSRGHFDFTFYTSTSHNGIISEPIAASSGASSLSVLKNLASVHNTGIEATINGTLIDRRALGWDVTLSASHNNNKILDLGVDPSTGKKRTNIGTGTSRDSIGLPVNAMFARPFHYSDANNDGIITPNEVTVDTGYTYMGYTLPRDIISFTNGVDLFNRHLRITTLFDYKGGSMLNNASGSFYETNFATFAATNIKSVGLFQQARAVAASSAKNPTTTDIGYRENGQEWRFREVSAALTLPTTFAQRVRARDVQLVFSARNIHVWTPYTGVDPEANYVGTANNSGDAPSNFSTTAPRTYFTLRANLHY
jgi:TonB-linked SusC/RagA family outer membrane protein